MTATAFWVPLQTKRLRPSRLEREAFGLAPKSSAGVSLLQIVSTIWSVRVSITLSVSLPALATTT